MDSREKRFSACRFYFVMFYNVHKISFDLSFCQGVDEVCRDAVRLGRESVSLDPTAFTGQTVQVGMQRENEIKTELDILRSRSLAERVVESVGSETILASQSFCDLLQWLHLSETIFKRFYWFYRVFLLHYIILEKYSGLLILRLHQS